MRILIVSEDVPYAAMGGLAKHALNLARALVKEGHTVDFLGGNQQPIEVAGQEGQFGGRFIGALNGHLAGWKEGRLGFFNPFKRSWLGRRFARIIAENGKGYDLIHYHGHVPNLAKYLPAGIPFIQTRHDQGSDCLTHTRFKNGAICASVDPIDCASCITQNPNALQRAVSTIAVRRYRQEVVEGFQRHSTVFVSEMLRRNFCRSMGVQDWGEVIHNFVDLDLVSRAALQPIRLPDAAPVEILVAGKLYPPKGIDQLVNLFALKHFAGVRLVVVGDGPQLAALKAQFASTQILFLGWCDGFHTLRLTAGASAVVVPSVWEEPCATTVLEGLALGRHCFAMAQGGTPELARYTSYPEQLHLHTSMQALVDDLANIKPSDHQNQAQPDEFSSATHALTQLMPIYRATLCH
jgi:glycosyltransferase involved in cell wall biosynthesis